MSLSGKIIGILLLILVVIFCLIVYIAYLDIRCVEKLLPKSLETQYLDCALPKPHVLEGKNPCEVKKNCFGKI